MKWGHGALLRGDTCRTFPYAQTSTHIGSDLFVDFLATKPGLTGALQSDDARSQALHTSFVDRLVPACSQLLHPAAGAGQIRADVDAYELLRGDDNLGRLKQAGTARPPELWCRGAHRR